MKKLFLLLAILGASASADSLTLDLVGISSHAGSLVNDQAWGSFKRKLSRTGFVVWNPEVNATYERNDWLFNATYMNNCLGDNAYLLAAGRQWRISKTFSVALLLGVFDTTKVSTGAIVSKTFNQTTHVTTSSTTYSAIRRRSFLPMPLVSLTKTVPLSEKLSVSSTLASNYELTHLTAGLKYEF